MASNRLSTGSVSFDSSTIAAFNSATLPAGGQLGQFIEKDGKKYQIVILDTSAVTAVAGHAVTWIDAAGFTVTNDISDNADGSSNSPAGLLLSVVTAGNYCFIQVRGEHPTAFTDGGDDIAAGDHCIVHASTDGALDRTAKGTAAVTVPMGVAIAADTSTTVAILLTVPLNGA